MIKTKDTVSSFEDVCPIGRQHYLQIKEWNGQKTLDIPQALVSLKYICPLLFLTSR